RGGLEGGQRIAARWAALDRPPFGFPLVEAAVENGRTVEAERAEHPPEARGPHHRADAVEHDAAVRAETVTAEGRLELRGRRHHEAQPRGPIGELSLQVEKVGAGDVRFLEGAAPGYRDVRIVASRRRRLEIRRAVIDAKVRPAEERRELRGAHEGLGISHAASLGVCAQSRGRQLTTPTTGTGLHESAQRPSRLVTTSPASSARPRT